MPVVVVVAVTGASFFVFSGALKSSSGYLAKSSIVEGKNWAACLKHTASLLPWPSSVVTRALLLRLGHFSHAAASALPYFLVKKKKTTLFPLMRRNLSRCCGTGTQENEGKIWSIWLVSLWLLYWFGLNEKIVSLRNAERIIHGPGGGSPAKRTLSSQTALELCKITNVHCWHARMWADENMTSWNCRAGASLIWFVLPLPVVMSQK